MKLLRAFDDYWYAPAPPERVALLRVAIGGFSLLYLIARFGNLTSVSRFQPAEFLPVGVVRVLAEPLPPLVVYVVLLLAIAAGAAFVAGFRYRQSGPLYALLFLWTTSYRNSWGMIFHVENLAVLHLLVLAACPAADVISFDARGNGAVMPRDGRYGWPIRAMTAVTAATYVIAGIAKLKFAGLAWAHGDFLRQQVAYDNLRKIELGSIHAPLGATLVQYGAPFATLALISLVLEFGAPLALFSARFARLWIAGAWAFHVAVAALMAIIFPYQLTLIAFLPYFELERWSIVRRIQARVEVARG